VPSDTHAAAGAGDALSQRARRRDRVQLGAECVRAQPANAVEARALAAARHARAAPSDTRDVAGAGDTLSQRARQRDRVKLGGECVRAQPAAAADARAPMPRFMQRWSFPPTTVSYCELQTLRRILALAPSAERPGRHGGSLAAGDELRPALLTKLVKLYGSYAALDGARRRPSATRLTPTPSDAYPCTLAPWCSVRTSVSVRRRALSMCEVA
jgi:hypothetical protein